MLPARRNRAAAARAGDGSVRVRLHDLPTVVLLNGRRLPNSGLGADASVDLNTLPMSFIERVEVLASGASAAFGADAVGGVVNIVTRRNNHGLELGGTRTITEHGDGEIVTGQAAIGFDLFGGTWSLGVDYVEQDGVTMDRRGYSAHSARHRRSQRNDGAQMVGIPCRPTDTFDGSGRKRSGTRRPVNTHACRVPPDRPPLTIDRTCALATASILRHSTIRRHRTSAHHSGCSAHVRWAKA